MSATVASHASNLPVDPGVSVTSFGRLPSDLRRPLGSLVAGIDVCTNERAADDVIDHRVPLESAGTHLT